MANASTVINGTIEVEFLCEGEGEADLHQHYNNCTKNPGHDNFIPVDQFTLDKLPQGYRERKLFELIKLQAELTVRLVVTFDREIRTKVIPGYTPNPSPTDSHKSRILVGTGYVTGVDISDLNPSLAEIRIHTSAHLFNEQPQYAQIKCDFFFDLGGTPELCNEVVRKELSIKIYNEKRDVCVTKANVTDPDLIKRLQDAVKNYKLSEKDVYDWYHKNSSSFIPTHDSDQEMLCVIVSHPHGCSKQISIGFCTSRNVVFDPFCSQLKYTTSTCSGSSGADIFVLGLTRNDHQHLHAGVSKDNTWNYSAEGLDLCNYIKRTNSPSRSPEADYGRQLLMNNLSEECHRGGSWETAFVHGGEAELQQLYDNCNKRPHHQKYIPLREFNKKDLPFVHDGKEAFDFIQLTSDLTVRVTVKLASHRKPGELSDVDVHDPRCSDNTSNMMIAGTGSITRVDKTNGNSKPCLCKECRESGTPKPEYAQIHVLTASKVVSDVFEGEESSCDLFFDSGFTPDDCSGAVSLTGAQRVPGETEEVRDLVCDLIYSTHDQVLADRLQDMLNKREDLKYEFKKCCRNVSDFSPRASTAIVFHSHGCGKHISLGKCMGRNEYKIAPRGFSHLLYEAPTCPGATGARVVFLHSDMLDRTVVHLEKCPLNERFNHCVII